MLVSGSFNVSAFTKSKNIGEFLVLKSVSVNINESIAVGKTSLNENITWLARGND